MNKKISALEKASEKLGTIALDVYAWFNQKHKDDNKNRNLFISAVYDYLKVLEVADSNSDNHSFKQLSDLIWSLVGLQENEHNNSYFRKFANVCVKGGLLLHWQDIKKEDDNNICIENLHFAKKDKITWKKTFKIKDKKRVSFRHQILKGDLVIPYSLLEPMVADNKGDKIDNEDNTLLLCGNDNINNLYKRFKDITSQELSDDIEADKTPELFSVIDAIKVVNEMFLDLTKDDNKTRSAMVDKDFSKHFKTLQENILAINTINQDLNIDDGKNGKNDSWTNDKKKTKELEKKIGTAQLSAIKNVNYGGK